MRVFLLLIGVLYTAASTWSGTGETLALNYTRDSFAHHAFWQASLALSPIRAYSAGLISTVQFPITWDSTSMWFGQSDTPLLEGYGPYYIATCNATTLVVFVTNPRYQGDPNLYTVSAEGKVTGKRVGKLPGAYRSRGNPVGFGVACTSTRLVISGSNNGFPQSNVTFADVYQGTSATTHLKATSSAWTGLVKETYYGVQGDGSIWWFDNSSEYGTVSSTGLTPLTQIIAATYVDETGDLWAVAQVANQTRYSGQLPYSTQMWRGTGLSNKAVQWTQVSSNAVGPPGPIPFGGMTYNPKTKQIVSVNNVGDLFETDPTVYLKPCQCSSTARPLGASQCYSKGECQSTNRYCTFPNKPVGTSCGAGGTCTWNGQCKPNVPLNTTTKWNGDQYRFTWPKTFYGSFHHLFILNGEPVVVGFGGGDYLAMTWSKQSKTFSASATITSWMSYNLQQLGTNWVDAVGDKLIVINQNSEGNSLQVQLRATLVNPVSNSTNEICRNNDCNYLAQWGNTRLTTANRVIVLDGNGLDNTHRGAWMYDTAQTDVAWQAVCATSKCISTFTELNSPRQMKNGDAVGAYPFPFWSHITTIAGNLLVSIFPSWAGPAVGWLDLHSPMETRIWKGYTVHFSNTTITGTNIANQRNPDSVRGFPYRSGVLAFYEYQYSRVPARPSGVELFYIDLAEIKTTTRTNAITLCAESRSNPCQFPYGGTGNSDVRVDGNTLYYATGHSLFVYTLP